MEIPEQFESKASCARCGWNELFTTKRSELNPENVYIWLAGITNRHRKAHPNCTGDGDDLRIKAFANECAEVN